MWVADYARLDIRTISRGSGNSDDEPAAKRPRFYNPFDVKKQAVKAPRTIAVIGDEYEAWQLDPREKRRRGPRSVDLLD